jgi:hypothetical protein
MLFMSAFSYKDSFYFGLALRPLDIPAFITAKVYKLVCDMSNLVILDH